MKYICDVCGYEYDETVGDPEQGIQPGTKWEDIPNDFLCPICSVGKDDFSKVQKNVLQVEIKNILTISLWVDIILSLTAKKRKSL